MLLPDDFLRTASIERMLPKRLTPEAASTICRWLVWCELFEFSLVVILTRATAGDLAVKPHQLQFEVRTRGPCVVVAWVSGKEEFDGSLQVASRLASVLGC